MFDQIFSICHPERRIKITNALGLSKKNVLNNWLHYNIQLNYHDFQDSNFYLNAVSNQMSCELPMNREKYFARASLSYGKFHMISNLREYKSRI